MESEDADIDLKVLKRLREQFEEDVTWEKPFFAPDSDKSLLIKYGKPIDVWNELLEEFEVEAIYTNHDYEPYAKERDQEVAELLESKEIPFHTFKDQCIFEKDEVARFICRKLYRCDC